MDKTPVVFLRCSSDYGRASPSATHELTANDSDRAHNNNMNQLMASRKAEEES